MAIIFVDRLCLGIGDDSHSTAFTQIAGFYSITNTV